jgi:hypothetical protein
VERHKIEQEIIDFIGRKIEKLSREDSVAVLDGVCDLAESMAEGIREEMKEEEG